MTTTTLDTAAIGSERSRPARLAPLAGLGLIGGLIALFVSPGGGEAGETPREVVAYAASHESWILAMAFFGLAVIPLGGVFVAALHARLRGIATATESTLVLIGGIAFTLSFSLALTIWSAPLTDIAGARELAVADAYLAIDDIGWFLFGASGVGVAMMAIPASLAALRGPRRPGVARLGRRRAGRRVARHDRVLRRLRLDGVDRRRVDRDARRQALAVDERVGSGRRARPPRVPLPARQASVTV